MSIIMAMGDTGLYRAGWTCIAASLVSKEETFLSHLTAKDHCIQDECETLFKQADIHQPNLQNTQFVHNLFPG